MNQFWHKRATWLRVLAPGACLLQLGSCLSDQQLTSILTSVISTGLTQVVTQAISAAFDTGAAMP